MRGDRERARTRRRQQTIVAGTAARDLLDAVICDHWSLNNLDAGIADCYRAMTVEQGKEHTIRGLGWLVHCKRIGWCRVSFRSRGYGQVGSDRHVRWGTPIYLNCRKQVRLLGMTN
jgi:hypothetical protein